MVYVDDGILIDPDNVKIEKDLQLKFEVQDEADLSDYLGVKVQKHQLSSPSHSLLIQFWKT
jgi:hypothetical protein